MATFFPIVPNGNSQRFSPLEESYLNYLTPRDQRIVEEAKKNIDRYRKVNVSLSVIGEFGEPLQDVQVSYRLICHDFLFGFQDFDPCHQNTLEYMKAAGFNLFVTTPYWCEIERTDDNFDWWIVDREKPFDLLNAGFKLKVHPVVYYDPGLIPRDKLGLDPKTLKDETLELVSAIVHKIPNASIYEISNEGNWKWGRASDLTREQYLDIVKAAAHLIRTRNPNATIGVNTAGPLGDLWPVPWTPPDDGYTMETYSWFKYLQENSLDYDYVGLQYRPGYYDQNRVCYATPYLHEISALLDKYSELGKRIHITEFEVPSIQYDGMVRYGSQDWSDEMQAAYTEGMYILSFSKPYVDSIIWWFIISNYEEGPEYQRLTEPILFDKNHNPKPAYYVLKKLITKDWNASGTSITDKDGQIKFQGFSGKYEITLSYGELSTKKYIEVYLGRDSKFTIEFNATRIREEIKIEKEKLKNEALSLLGQVQFYMKYAANTSSVKHDSLKKQFNSLLQEFKNENYAEVKLKANEILQNPFNITVDGKGGDWSGICPVASKTPGVGERGREIKALYILVDAINLYGLIEVQGPPPRSDFLIETMINNYRIHMHTSSPFMVLNIDKDLILGFVTSSVGESIEFSVSLKALGYPKAIEIRELFSWNSSTGLDYDVLHLREVIELPIPESWTLRFNTSLKLNAPLSAVEGETVTLVAVLKDEEGCPVENATLVFYVQNDAGRRTIGSEKTNTNGSASISYRPDTEGLDLVEVAYDGDALHMSSSARTGLTVKTAGRADQLSYILVGSTVASLLLIGVIALKTRKKRIKTIHSDLNI